MTHRSLLKGSAAALAISVETCVKDLFGATCTFASTKGKHESPTYGFGLFLARFGFVLLVAGWGLAEATSGQDSADAILRLNQAASGGHAWSKKSTLELRFSYTGEGLRGEVNSVRDLKTGAFIETQDIGPTHQGNGFDGSEAWAKDISGAITPEAGGDKHQLAVNEAYRNSHAWWHADRGGATVEREGSQQADGRTYDVLTVTPEEGKPFEAWFDADTHLLARTVEKQQFLTVTTTYSDYHHTNGVMIAGKVVIDDGSGPDGLETRTLLSAKFLPARPKSAYRMKSGVPNDTVIERRAPQTTVPFELLNNHIYINVSINNKGPFRVMVDTGGHNILMPRTAKALGLEVTGQSPATGGGEETALSGYAHVDEIKIGEAIIRDQEVFVLQLHPDAVEGFPGGGMIGLEVFRRFVTNIDYGKKTLTLIKPAAFQPPKDAVAIKFTIYDNIPQVEGSFEGLPGKFDIDTGSREEVNITTPFVNSNSLREKSKGVIATNGWGAGGRVQSYVTRGSDLQLGGITIKNVVASLAIQKKGAFSDPNFAGNVGSALLKRFDVTFDYDNQVMYLKPLPEPVADTDVFDRSGMWINAQESGFQVMSLTSGGPAENAGIKVGDIITAVNGAAVESSKLSDFRMELRDDPPGTVIHLTIRNAGGSRVVPLTLQDQI